MATFLFPEAEAQLSSILQTASKTTPNLHATIVNQTGEIIFSHDSTGPKETSIFWLASCIKLITAVATMQLVEQGTIELDDEEIVERLCPELKELKVLDGVDKDNQTKYAKKEKAITVRMLLSHTGMSLRFIISNSRSISINFWQFFKLELPEIYRY